MPEERVSYLQPMFRHYPERDEKGSEEDDRTRELEQQVAIMRDAIETFGNHINVSPSGTWVLVLVEDVDRLLNYVDRSCEKWEELMSTDMVGAEWQFENEELRKAREEIARLKAIIGQMGG